MSDYFAGSAIVGSEYLFALADALKVSPRWLLLGQTDPQLLLEARDADWVSVPEYDLREFNEHGKGEPLGAMPVRRDWLAATIGTSSGVWTTRLLADYEAAGLLQSTPVFCGDIGTEDLQEGWACFFRINGGIVPARFSFRSTSGFRAGDRLGELVVSASEIGTDDDRFEPISRILGVFARRI